MEGIYHMVCDRGKICSASLEATEYPITVVLPEKKDGKSGYFCSNVRKDKICPYLEEKADSLVKIAAKKAKLKSFS